MGDGETTPALVKCGMIDSQAQATVQHILPDRSAGRWRTALLGSAIILAILAGVAWLTRADAIFLEYAAAALAMCF